MASDRRETTHAINEISRMYSDDGTTRQRKRLKRVVRTDRRTDDDSSIRRRTRGGEPSKIRAARRFRGVALEGETQLRRACYRVTTYQRNICLLTERADVASVRQSRARTARIRSRRESTTFGCPPRSFLPRARRRRRRRRP